MPTPDYTALQKSIGDASFNIGKTNREVRDKLEKLAKVVDGRSEELSGKISSLSSEIKKASETSGRLATAMIWLTVVLAVAAVVSAIAAFTA